jgi:hypothetical protein
MYQHNVSLYIITSDDEHVALLYKKYYFYNKAVVLTALSFILYPLSLLLAVKSNTKILLQASKASDLEVPIKITHIPT